jgi:hypothetical protein
MNAIALPADSRAPWVRDFALVGGLTGFLAPYSVIHEVPYSAVTGVGGALSGAVLGAFSAWLLSGFGRRWPKVVFLPLGLIIGALWGSAAAMATVVTPARHLLVLSVLFAGAAGALQLGWFWLAYCYRRVNRRSTWGVVLIASLLGGGLGFAGFGAMMVLH